MAGHAVWPERDDEVRFDVGDPSKLYGDVAKGWTVSPDGKKWTDIANGDFDKVIVTTT